MKNVLLVASLAIAPGIAVAQGSAPITEAELSSRIRGLLDSLHRTGEFSGVVAVGRRGEIVFSHAVGYRNRQTRALNDVETGFNIGSINKLITNIALRMLAAEGKLNLDSSLAAAWPDYPHADVARRVTIRQMMTHRSGITGNIFADPPGKTRHDIRHNRDYLPLVSSELAFEPGSRQAYSNAGYIVLGALIERITGMDYYDFVRTRIYAPAGLERTGHWRKDSLPPNTVTGYLEDGQSNHETLPGRGSAAGGGYSTARDLLRLVQALRDRKFAGGPAAGLGVAGGAPGLNAVLDGEMPGAYDIVVLANQSPRAAEKVARAIRGWLGADD